MIIRILYALRHARMRAKSTGVEMRLTSLIPRRTVMAAAGASTVLLRSLASTGRWEYGLKGKMELVGSGAVLGLGTVGVIALAEKRDVLNIWKGKKE